MSLSAWDLICQHNLDGNLVLLHCSDSRKKDAEQRREIELILMLEDFSWLITLYALHGRVFLLHFLQPSHSDLNP